MNDIVTDHDLSGANTLGLPCIAERYVAVTQAARLPALLAMAKARGWLITVLGGGSNVILPPRLEGLVIQPMFRRFQLEELGREEVTVLVEAGLPWHELVMATVTRGLWGIENLALIPGSCGAAPIQNIGAYGVELADVLESVEIMHLDTGLHETLSRDDCELAYRDSIFKRSLENRVLITRLTLRLSRRPCPRLAYGDLVKRLGEAPTALEVAQAVSQVRREKLPDPTVLGNAGSFFKNPLVSAGKARALLEAHSTMPHFPQPDGSVKLAAGWLIDRCGLKGYRQGAFGVHDRQALVMVHHGGGDARGLLEFAAEVAGRVETHFGIHLEREPRLIGATG
ncbi:UDP-N-acetylmuramate dehydrogenase [Vreelandella populi]|uniref:UDP-N-acetylmuramate dehydrogenase n=1 Tax=Halomonadaceae TaxID=28256 RepID=UPI0030ED2B9A